MSLQSTPSTQLPPQAATEYAIREAVKEDERRGGDDNKKDDGEKEGNRESGKEGKRADGKVAEQKVIAKGKMRDQGRGGGSGGRGGYGGSSSRKDMSKVIEKDSGKSAPIDLRGRFAQRLAKTLKAAEPSHAQLTQEVINKIINYVRVGINMKGEKEIQIELNEKIFRGLKLRVIARGGKVGVMFKASDPKGREILEKNKEGLSKALGDRGIVVDEIVVS